MKSWQLDRKIDALSERLNVVSSGVVRLDFDSFSEPEKQLFNKIWEIQQQYGLNPPPDFIEANKELIFKASEVISWRALELFMFVMKELLREDEIEEWYFKLHFYNFFADLADCLANVRKWSQKDRDEFLKDMKESGMINKVFRAPRGLSIEDSKEKRSKQEDTGNGSV